MEKRGLWRKELLGNISGHFKALQAVEVLFGQQVSETGLWITGWDLGTKLCTQNRAPVPKRGFALFVPSASQCREMSVFNPQRIYVSTLMLPVFEIQYRHGIYKALVLDHFFVEF